jgi:NADH-quinone oxidoreductase subunit M
VNPALRLGIPLVWLLPAVAALLVRFVIHDTRIQRLTALATAWLVFLATIALFIENGWGDSVTAYARDSLESSLFSGMHFHMAVDGLNAVLLPMTAALALALLLSIPRSDLRGDTAAQILATESALLGCFLSLDLSLLAIFWVASLVPLWQSVRRARDHALHVVMSLTLGATALATLFAVVLLAREAAAAGLAHPLDLQALTSATSVWGGVAGGLFLFAALLRMGIAPLHLWLTAAAGRAPGYAAMLALITPLGSFGLARVVMPVFPELYQQMSGPLVLLGGATALYGAMLAVGQYDLRRVVGYFWISQMGLVLTGLAALNASGVAGGLLQSMSSVVEVGGLMLIALEVEARAGTTDMRLLGGLVHRAPRMATAFVLLSAAAVGFPGTVSFVAEDLAIQGLLYEHELVASIILIVTAINGITLFKAFKQTFLGSGSHHAKSLRAFEDLRGWEYLACLAMMGTLLVGGFMPQPLLAIRQGVVETVHRIEVPTHHGHGEHDEHDAD